MKTVIEMAREAGCYAEMGLTAGNMTAALERFAALVREDEREACAKVCEDETMSGEYYAKAIQARGENK